VKIWFAACARDCAGRLSQNVASLLNAAEAAKVDDVRVYIAENDSTDCTRDIILRLAANDLRVVPVLFQSLEGQFSTRESRIAFCRDELLKLVASESSDGLYCPVDLDIDLSSLCFAKSFFESCRLVDSGICTAVFPSSFPFYYDIYALREREWCPGSCLKEVQCSNARGAFWTLLAYIRYVSYRQKHYTCLQAQGLIPVDSAFGGVGIYSLDQVLKSGARYSTPELEQDKSMLCEHVVFNRFLDRLFINSAWVISAPVDHVEFRLLSAHGKAKRIMRAAFDDVKWLSLRIARRIKSKKPLS